MVKANRVKHLKMAASKALVLLLFFLGRGFKGFVFFCRRGVLSLAPLATSRGVHVRILEVSGLGWFLGIFGVWVLSWSSATFVTVACGETLWQGSVGFGFFYHAKWSLLKHSVQNASPLCPPPSPLTLDLLFL